MNRKFTFLTVFYLLMTVLLVGYQNSNAKPMRSTIMADFTFEEPEISFQFVTKYGETGEPYPADEDHLNGPFGIYIDASDNLYMVEKSGSRMLQFDSSGTNTLIIGDEGINFVSDDTLQDPKDVITSNSGNIWITDSDRVTEYDPDGNYLQQMGGWWDGSGDYGFYTPSSLVFDSGDRLYVADAGNHRIQVYTFTLSTPVYSTTIGTTGVSGIDNSHFNNPSHIAFDSSERLYVMDTFNNRVQRCTFGSDWTCSTFFGVTGEYGSDLSHLGEAYGITIKNDNIFIADSENYRVLKCNTSGSCSHFGGTTGVKGTDNSHFGWPVDVAVDSSGNVYISDWDNHRIQKFNSGGGYVDTIGVTLVPYDVDSSRYNAPGGLAVTADGSLYVTENRGFRLVKLNASGTQLWTAGQAGVFGNDNSHFGSIWNGPEGNLVVDAGGYVYVPDTGNERIQIYNTSGTYITTFGGYGTGSYGFNCPRGMAISPVNADIFVADSCNERVQIFDSNRVYKATIGVTNVSGTDNGHFNTPTSVAVDSSGTIYVADSYNHRVQVFDSSYTWQRTIGVTGQCGADLGYLCGPTHLAVDGYDRVYIVEQGNQRVQVFDDSGVYVTTIGGKQWSDSDGHFGRPKGIAVDSAGNVYVSDYYNQTIQKFSPRELVPDWQQTVVNGFENPYNAVIHSLEPFNGDLFIGIGNWEQGTQVWRSSDGSTWTSVSEVGFGLGEANPTIIDMIEFKDQLYASTGWAGNGGQIWRSPNGTDWYQVEAGGFGTDDNYAITALGVFSDTLYASTHNEAGLEIWRSSTGNLGDWTRVVTAGNGNENNALVTSFIEFKGLFYAGIENRGTDGAQIWRTNDGEVWTAVVTGGFNSTNNSQTGGFAILDDYLYIGTRNHSTGGQIWRSSNGTQWFRVVDDGFGDSNNLKIEAIVNFDESLFAGTTNVETGIEVWRSEVGTTWEQINIDGFGDPHNTSTLWNSSSAVFNGQFYIGTGNSINGGEAWRYPPSCTIFIPVVYR